MSFVLSPRACNSFEERNELLVIEFYPCRRAARDHDRCSPFQCLVLPSDKSAPTTVRPSVIGIERPIRVLGSRGHSEVLSCWRILRATSRVGMRLSNSRWLMRPAAHHFAITFHVLGIFDVGHVIDAKDESHFWSNGHSAAPMQFVLILSVAAALAFSFRHFPVPFPV